ncbi:MAG: phosphodiester glycosidase family protein [Candidatus Adiutrix sp.]|jgi:hypothetical protein|nr:phosphodiester glycosidase family protein [Candidatus Adiutrix sp.]
MFHKIKIYILPLTAFTLMALSCPLSLRAGAGNNAAADFSGNAELRQAIWRLAAWLPESEDEAPSASRTLTINGAPGLPPFVVNMFFDESLSPWPSRLTITFQAEAVEPSLTLVISDQRPFGGPNLKLTGTPAGSAKESAAAVLEILKNLHARLEDVMPRLAPLVWQRRAEGLETAKTRLLYGARLGSNELYLIRLHAAEFTFRPYHENEFPDQERGDVRTWAARLPQAAILINGGQYYPDRNYMGSLKRDGFDLSAAEHESWRGILAADPRPEAPPGAPLAALIDLETRTEPWLPAHFYNAMQSFMLLDRLGRIRVRDSFNLASRSAIGQDARGNIVLIMTPAAVSLYDLAVALKDPALDLVQVMGLDGGFEAQIMIRQDGAVFASCGVFSITANRALFLPGYSAPLPAVLAVEPR